MVWTKVFRKVQQYGKLVMFSHTIFSLSFALLSMTLAAQGLPEGRLIFWILLCFLAARTGANAINRAIDAEIDARNPRTADRQLPKGEMGKREVVLLSVVCFAVMLVGAWQINFLCFLLSPVALFLLVIYSYCKRFTPLCHLVLGITCACAPVGAWLAVTGELALLPLLMGAANTLWVAGFDTIYGCQDYDFDTANGLYSIPQTFGVAAALRIAAVMHGAAWLLLLGIGTFAPALGVLYFVGVAIIGILFLAEYRMVSPQNLTRVNIASYSVNQLVSICLLIFGVLDVFL